MKLYQVIEIDVEEARLTENEALMVYSEKYCDNGKITLLAPIGESFEATRDFISAAKNPEGDNSYAGRAFALIGEDSVIDPPIRVKQSVQYEVEFEPTKKRTRKGNIDVAHSAVISPTQTEQATNIGELVTG